MAERLSNLKGAVRRLPRPVLGGHGPATGLDRRGWLLETGLALGLALVAILTHDGSDDDRTFFPPELLGPQVPDPPQPVLPPGFPPPDHGWGWAGDALLLVLIATPLVLRRRYPLSTLWISLLVATMVAPEPGPLRLAFYVCVIAAYSAAVYSPYRGPALASLPVAALILQRLQSSEPDTPFGGAISAVPQGAVPFLIMAPIAVAAWALRASRARAHSDAARVVTMERERAEAVRRAAEEERSRIARELHDVVTHNVSVMVIQAGAARTVLDASPEQAREALLSVEASGRAAMTELRHVMGLLTMDGEAAELAPQPGLSEVLPLVERVREAGVPVELVMTGRAGAALPDGVDLTAYRIVQESLTNTLKHAAGASAAVRVDHGADRLHIEVTDTGGQRAGSADAGSGRGLMGLRDRVAMYGGTLKSGPRVTGGFRVEATIPLPGVSASDALAAR